MPSLEELEPHNQSMMDSFRNRTAVALGTLTAALSLGIAEGVASAESLEHQSEPVFPVVTPVIAGEAPFVKTASVAMSQKEIAIQIKKWKKTCTKELTVNPDEQEHSYDHDVDKTVGRLDVVRGTQMKFVLQRKPGVKRCGAYGVTAGYIDADGTIHRAERIIARPIKPDTYLNPGNIYASFHALVRPAVKR